MLTGSHDKAITNCLNACRSTLVTQNEAWRAWGPLKRLVWRFLYVPPEIWAELAATRESVFPILAGRSVFAVTRVSIFQYFAARNILHMIEESIFRADSAEQILINDPHGLYLTCIYCQCLGHVWWSENSRIVEGVIDTTISITIAIIRDALSSWGISCLTFTNPYLDI